MSYEKKIAGSLGLIAFVAAFWFATQVVTLAGDYTSGDQDRYLERVRDDAASSCVYARGTGLAATTDLDPAGYLECVEAAEEIARLSWAETNGGEDGALYDVDDTAPLS